MSFQFLSHILDPDGYAWPGEPVVKVTQCTDVSEECPFCSFISELPNHFGTHMDAPRYFVKDGLSINELPIEYFTHTKVALIDIPKGPAEGIYREDLEPFADILSQVSCALFRTGLEKYRDTDQNIYQNEGSFIAPSAGDYLTENFPNLKTIGMDFLAIGSASEKCKEGELPPDCHRHVLGYYSGKFVTGIEDMHLSDLPKNAKISFFTNAPLRIKGLDSSQVVCIAQVED
ncbi:cyclase family protein [Pseudoramibacter sp.]|jgi:kynurenine formamidase|uniref:cyclase family protein n=1 Tax=Pseudoramibacter sp. TaxID=2034862 RepID=UPI0025F959EC|nr:cyclase family protein [Pseudoramibacter sp.]MCH4072592.1 cyclase family protein [Pseudoramibacter sp.]MCH4106363.1 cyclase family protein [Pseudoramibacter sp.]